MEQVQLRVLKLRLSDSVQEGEVLGDEDNEVVAVLREKLPEELKDIDRVPEVVQVTGSESDREREREAEGEVVADVPDQETVRVSVWEECDRVDDAVKEGEEKLRDGE
eukprot:RCo003182